MSPTKAIQLAVSTIALWGISGSKIDIGKLADQSTVIVQAHIERVNTSLDAAHRPNERTATATIQEVLIGDRTLARRTVTLVLSKTATLRAGSDAVIFADLKQENGSTSLLDLGEMTLQEVEDCRDAFDTAIQDRRDLPIRELIRNASRVFRGKVEEVDTTSADWQVLTVRVGSSIYRAETSYMVRVALGPKHSKVKSGQDSVFIVRKPGRDEPNHETVVTDPNGVQPAVLEMRIRDLVKKEIPSQ